MDRMIGVRAGQAAGMSRRPAAVAFDVNETLFSLEPVTTRLRTAGLPADTLPLWFTRVLRDGFALAASGGFAAFSTLARGHMRRVLASYGADPDRADTVLSAFGELPPQPDAEAALTRLKEAGVPAVTLTNGHAETSETLVRRAGFDDLLDRCLSVDDAGIWKPHAEAYHYAARACGVAPGRLALVAVHSWDVHGARQAGLVSGYASRFEGGLLKGFDEPDVSATGVDAVVERLLALPV